MKFSELQENDRKKNIRQGDAIVLSCTLTHEPSAHVHWYKDGVELLPQINLEIQSDGLTRRLVIQSAETKHSGTYECSTSDDAVTFKVDVKGDLFVFLLCSYCQHATPSLSNTAPGSECSREREFDWLGSAHCPLLCTTYAIFFSQDHRPRFYQSHCRNNARGLEWVYQ